MVVLIFKIAPILDIDDQRVLIINQMFMLKKERNVDSQERKIRRKELYEEVWTLPVTKLAKRYGLKRVDKLQIKSQVMEDIRNFKDS